MELLGECLIYSKEKKKKDIIKRTTKPRFEAFLKKFLDNYFKYELLLREDLRHGAAHFGFPKGVIVPSYDRRAQKSHLKFIKDPYTNTKHLIIYSPQFLKDLNSALETFISYIKNGEISEKHCIEVMKKIMQDGQKVIKKTRSLKEEIENASKERLYRDTYPHLRLRR